MNTLKGAWARVGGGRVSYMHEMQLAQPLEEATSLIYLRRGLLQWLGKPHLMHMGDMASSNG